MDITKHYNFYKYVIESLKLLGGSGTNYEILEKIINLANLNSEEIDRLHCGGPTTVADYQVAWAKTYLKAYGYIDTSGRGIWHLTEKAKEPIASNEEITSFYRSRKRTKNKTSDSKDLSPKELNDQSEEWMQDIIKRLSSISPAGFERLCQRLLREKGFSEVKVTGKVGDKGIDGIGILKLSLISFRVVFQCKRYVGTVGSGDIRNFRGAVSGKADRGIFLTTGHFSRSAIEEASRPGADPIELINGVDICNLLKELSLGVKTKEIVSVDDEWFDEFN